MRAHSGRTQFFGNSSENLTTGKQWLALVLLGTMALLFAGLFPTAHAHYGIAQLAGPTFTVNSTADPGGAFVNCTTRGGECTFARRDRRGQQ